MEKCSKLYNVNNAIGLLQGKRKKLQNYVNDKNLWDSGEYDETRLQMQIDIQACDEAIEILKEVLRGIK